MINHLEESPRWVLVGFKERTVAALITHETVMVFSTEDIELPRTDVESHLLPVHSTSGNPKLRGPMYQSQENTSSMPQHASLPVNRPLPSLPRPSTPQTGPVLEPPDHVETAWWHCLCGLFSR